MHQLSTLVKQFSGGNQALAVRVNQEIDPAKIASALKLPPSSRLLMLSGGAINLSADNADQLLRLFAEIGQTVRDNGITVIDGGTQAGVMQMMGQALREAGAEVNHVGVLPARAVADAKGTHAEDMLEPHHSCFVLVDSDAWGDEVQVMYALADYLSAEAPSIAMLINGGEISLKEIEWNVKQGREIVVIKGSGRLADEIAKAVLHPENPVRGPLEAIARNGKFTLFDLSTPPERLAQILKRRLLPPP